MSSSPQSLYLDNAATSFPKPDVVNQAVMEYMMHNGSPFGRGSYTTSDDSGRIVTQCRQRIARLLNANSANEIAFAFNCTDSLNLLLRGVLKQGDRVVTTALEHNSVLRPLNQLQAELGIVVEFADFDPVSGVVDLDQLTTLIQAKPTRLVVLNHASNVTGTIQPATDITKIAHKAGSLVLLDAAQTTGHWPLDVCEMGVDMLASAGHKGLLGPLGTGIVYLKDGLQEQIKPVRCGGTGTSSESIEQPTTMPEIFESGNLNMPGLAGLNASTDWLLKQDRKELHSRILCLTNDLNQRLREIDGVTLLGPVTAPEVPNMGIVSFLIDGFDSREAATILDQSFGIQCRAGFHCAPLVHKAYNTAKSGGSLRFSPGLFTKEADIDTAVDAIQQLTMSLKTL